MSYREVEDDDEPDDDNPNADAWDARELPDDSDTDDDDDPELVPCPYCGKRISEDAELCPKCNSFISIEDAPPQRRPWLILVGAVAALAGVTGAGWMLLRWW